MKYTKVLLGGAFVFLLASCSSTKIAYNFLDWAFNWHIGKYVSLDDKQKPVSKKAIDEFHIWHRKTQLPLYADYIKELKPVLLSGEVTGEQIHNETDKVQVLLDQAIEHLIPAIVLISASLSDKQAEELQKNLEDERNKYKKKYLDVDQKKRVKLRKKELNKFLERLIGNLNSEQKDWLDEWAKAMLPYEELTFRQQKIWADNAAIAMQHRDDLDILEKHVRGLLFYHSDNWDEDSQRALDINQDITYKFIAKVMNNLSPKQRRHLEKKLDDFIEDFISLNRAN